MIPTYCYFIDVLATSFSAFCTTHGLSTHARRYVWIRSIKVPFACYYFFLAVFAKRKKTTKKRRKKIALFFSFSFSLFSFCFLAMSSGASFLCVYDLFFYFFSRLDSITVRLSCPQYSSGSLPVGSCQASFVCEQS